MIKNLFKQVAAVATFASLITFPIQAFAELMGTQGNKYAASVDLLYYFLLVVSLISCILVFGGMFYFVVKYRRRSDVDQTPYISHNNTLEFLWSFIPFVIFFIVFVWGWRLFVQAENAPKGAFEIHVYAKQWGWDFEYKSGRTAANEFVVPVGRPIKLIMTSKDVLHSFFIPALRIKQDVIPGRYTAMWFEVGKQGEYQVFCTEYCGKAHSAMLAKLKVVSEAEFDAWLADDPLKAYEDMPLAMRGEKVMSQNACTACHNINTEDVKIGPAFKNLFGKTRNFADGSSRIADADYIRQSIREPQSQIVSGFENSGAMPAFPLLKEQEITWIIEYIKSISANADAKNN